jgi:hypothetical protein
VGQERWGVLEHGRLRKYGRTSKFRRDLPERGHVDPVTDSHRNEPADSSPTDLAPDPSRESTWYVTKLQRRVAKHLKGIEPKGQP